MSAPDVPDYQRARTDAQIVLGNFGMTDLDVTVEIPATIRALWLWIGPPPGTPDVQVIGTSTNVTYPTAQPLIDAQNLTNAPTLVFVNPALDPEVRIIWSESTDADWWVVGDTRPSYVIEATLNGAGGQWGQPVPQGAVLVGGSDGTNLQALAVTDTGELIISGGAFPSVYGPPATATPADAILFGGSDGTDLRFVRTDTGGYLLTKDQGVAAIVGTPGSAAPSSAALVGGTDGTDLRALKTDSSGVLQVSGSSFPAVYGAPGTTPPADVLALGGTDGTDLRALLTQAGGTLLVADLNVEGATGAPGSSLPTRAMAVAGTDGTDLRGLRTSKTGLQYAVPSAPPTDTADRPPNDLLWASVSGVTTTAALIAAPGAGLRVRLFWLYSWSSQSGTTGWVQVTYGGNALIFLDNEYPGGQQGGPATFPLTGVPLDANTIVYLVIAAGKGGATAGYTVETI